MTCIFIFRRDLRLIDNHALILAAQKAEKILPLFIYDHNQQNGSKNFLKIQEEALDDLSKYISNLGGHLVKIYGTPYKVVRFLINQYKPKYVAFNIDYSSYSNQRDLAIAEVCKELNVELILAHDVMMTETAFVKQFFLFQKEILSKTIIVKKLEAINFEDMRFPQEKSNLLIVANKIPIVATRKWALDRIKKFVENPTELFQKSKMENTMISAHLKLGLISAREVYKYAEKHNCGYLINQLIWREFWFALARTKQNHYDFYDVRFKLMQWINDPKETKKMWTGKTGYPLIDASMNELNKTGFMWNRGRMLVGFFSVKILRINPFLPPQKDHKWHMGGQAYFSQKLIDCCYANNTGNWHWVASDTVDVAGQRYSAGWAGRPMNVTKYKYSDNTWSFSDEEYLKKWLPEYKDYDEEKIVDFTERWKQWLLITRT